MLVVFVFVLLFHVKKGRGGSVSEWLGRWTYDSEARSSSPALTARWICSL